MRMKNNLTKTCCGTDIGRNAEHPDHTKEISRINRIQGQLEGIKKMISERKYCPDIITQTSAVRAAITSLETVILEKHLSSCVRDAFKGNQSDSEEKISELVEIFRLGAK